LPTAIASLREHRGDLTLWSAQAPAKVVQSHIAGDEAREWLAWRKYLANRRRPVKSKYSRLLDNGCALLWGIEGQPFDRALAETIEGIGTTASGNDRQHAIAELLTDFAEGGEPVDERRALGYLACAYALPALAEDLSRRRWWDLASLLNQTAIQSDGVNLSEQPLLHQWLAGELPLVLAALLPEVAPLAALLPQACRAFAVGFEELLDGKGMPQCQHLKLQQPLVACWTRARLMSASLSEGCWTHDVAAQYPLAVREMLRLARRDLSPLLHGAAIEKQCSASRRRFFTIAVRLSEKNKNHVALRLIRAGDSRKRRKERDEHAPAPANRSEWAQVAVLRPNWRAVSPRLAITYGQRSIHGELAIDRDVLFSGQWRWECMVGSQAAQGTADWEEVCWVSDEDVDYLELELPLSQGLKIQRQICLGRKDRFLFVGDAVLGSEARSLDYAMHLPLGPGISASPSAASREVLLNGRKPRALVLPLAWPEWRVDPRGGELTADENGLSVRTQASGKSLYVPLWIDLDPRRHDTFTWRQLTVAEDRVIQPRDDAVGYRVQFGKKQWLIYRSLGRVGNRTILGHNLATEFLIARFGRDGGVMSLIEVE
jgi:hypothetical protein